MNEGCFTANCSPFSEIALYPKRHPPVRRVNFRPFSVGVLNSGRRQLSSAGSERLCARGVRVMTAFVRNAAETQQRRRKHRQLHALTLRMGCAVGVLTSYSSCFPIMMMNTIEHVTKCARRHDYAIGLPKKYIHVYCRPTLRCIKPII